MAVTDSYQYHSADFTPLEEVVGLPLVYKSWESSWRESTLLAQDSNAQVLRKWTERYWRYRSLVHSHSFQGSIEYRPGRKPTLFGWKVPLFSYGKLVILDSFGKLQAETDRLTAPTKIITPQCSYMIHLRILKSTKLKVELLDGKQVIAECLYELTKIHRVMPDLPVIFPLFQYVAYSLLHQS